jgi:hypothetical protein
MRSADERVAGWWPEHPPPGDMSQAEGGEAPARLLQKHGFRRKRLSFEAVRNRRQ